MNALRVVAAAFRYQLKEWSRSTGSIIYSILVPLVYATIGFFLFRAGRGEQTLLWVALGAGLMGIWSATLVGSGMALQRQRWAGTLELLVAAPPPLVLVLAGVTLHSAAIGLYALVATLGWGALLFGMPFGIEQPFMLALSIPVTIAVLGLLGLVLAATFMLYRQTYALTNVLEYPFWLVSGLLVPLSLLPGWTEALAWAIGPSWGVRAIHDSTFGGNPLPELGAAVVLGAFYAWAGAVCMAYVERLAREKATLALT